MTNLTEQWKKGELPEGDYYIKRRNGDTLYDNIDSRGVWRNSIDEDIIEVLAEVPSYELWKAVHEQWKVLLEENTKLKELLKECYLINEMVIHTFNWLETIVTPSQKHICPKVVGGINKTQQRINQVLGEE